MNGLNHEAQQRYNRYVIAALRGGCDQKQAENIAQQRYVEEANRQSETIRAARRMVSLPSR